MSLMARLGGRSSKKIPFSLFNNGEEVDPSFLSGGDTRTKLEASTDRIEGFWNPTTTGVLDNTDLSVVTLQIPNAGNWLIGFEGYVRGIDSAPTVAEVDVALTPGEQADPFADAIFPCSGAILVNDSGTCWLQAIGLITVTDPMQLAAYLYGPVAESIEAKSTRNPDAPRLFAWPV